jgi:hypothetical protein
MLQGDSAGPRPDQPIESFPLVRRERVDQRQPPPWDTQDMRGEQFGVNPWCRHAGIRQNGRGGCDLAIESMRFQTSG